MSAPHEFVPNSSNTYHHDGMTPLVIQAAHSNSNFSLPMAMTNLNSNHHHLNGGNFFPNSLSYDVASLPLFHHHHPPPPLQRPAAFNSPAAFARQKPARMENFSKPELAQAPIADGRTNVFNTESVPNSLCWSRQPPLSPFGVLPHEISSDHMEEPPKTAPYDTLTPQFSGMQQPLSNIVGAVDCDKTAQQLNVVAAAKSKEQTIKHQRPPYVAKPVDVKLNTLLYQPENMSFHNGVISHGVQGVPKVDHTKLINSNYKAKREQLDSGAVASDYRVFKPPGLFPNAATTPVVKYTGKAPKQPPIHGVDSLQQHQKMPAEYHEDSQSSVGSLTDDYSSPPQMVPHTPTMKEVERRESFHAVNHLSNVVPSSYREMQQDINCHHVADKRVTSPAFLKLPYSPIANTPNLLPEASFHSSHPSYALYNGANTTEHDLAGPDKREKSELPQPQPPHLSMKLPIPADSQNMNGLVGYPSVIMRTNRNYQDEKPDKSNWVSSRQITQTSGQPTKREKFQTNLIEQHALLAAGGGALTDRQHAYFDTTCPAQIAQPVIKCSPALVARNVYEERQQQLVSSRQDPIHYQQQYLPVNKIQMANSNHPSAENRPSELTNAKPAYPRKRKSSSSKKNMHVVQSAALTEYDNRGSSGAPPHNLYTHSSNYMDSPRYEPTLQQHLPKRYPNDQYYTATAHSNYTSIPHNHQTVISSNGSPATNVHHRQMPTSSTLPLSAYFASFEPSLNYASQEFVPSPGGAAQQTYNIAESSHTPLQQPDDGRPKVIVPDVEEEFKFLFDPQLPNYKEIASNEGEDIYKPPSGKASQFYRKNTEFLDSYIKFLENNCESVETLADSSSFSSMKNWNRSKVVYQSVTKDNEQTTPVVPATPIAAPAEIKKVECDFENDPRYYPLPKSTDKRRLDSSSEDEADDVPQKKSKHQSFVGNKSNNISTAISKERREHKPKGRSRKEKELRKDLKSVRTKLEKLKKVKLKGEKHQQKQNCVLKSDCEKDVEPYNEAKLVKQILMTRGKLPNDNIKNIPKSSVSRRKVSERKAKLNVKSKVRRVATDSDSEAQSSSDSDPSWMPSLDDDDNVPVRRSSRVRSVQPGRKRSISLEESTNELEDNLRSKKDNINNNFEPQKSATCSEKATIKVGCFYMEKNCSNGKRIVLRKLKGKRLQKFEQLQGNGKFCGSEESIKLSEIDLSKLQEVEVNIVEKNKARFVVQLCEQTDIPTYLKIKEKFLKESLCYETQFAVYIQTLISQSLDSNFLNEIVKENDVYFLKNMKVIDDVTATYLSDLTAVVKWGTNSVNVLVKTWPFVSIKNIRNQSANDSCKCTACSQSDARQTAIFYGQPYLRETLQGCQSNSNIPNNLDKTVNLCSGCARKVKLFNKIWHQKYHVFVECAKSVSKKRSENESNAMTGILNELLADTAWLSKLFYDIRNTWLEIWTLVQKVKKS